MEQLVSGFHSFQTNIFPERKALFKRLASAQHPKALFISCSDSRLVPEMITQQEPGELFVIRNAGNIVPPFGPEPGGVSATIEYAVVALGISDLIICGHSNCGAMKAISSRQRLDNMPAVSHWLHYCDAAKAVVESYKYECDDERLLAMVRENVVAQLHNIKTHPCVVVALRKGELRLHGWVYDIETGAVTTLNKETHQFLLLSENPDVHYE